MCKKLSVLKKLCVCVHATVLNECVYVSVVVVHFMFTVHLCINVNKALPNWFAVWQHLNS